MDGRRAAVHLGQGYFDRPLRQCLQVGIPLRRGLRVGHRAQAQYGQLPVPSRRADRLRRSRRARAGELPRHGQHRYDLLQCELFERQYREQDHAGRAHLFGRTAADAEVRYAGRYARQLPDCAVGRRPGAPGAFRRGRKPLRHGAVGLQEHLSQLFRQFRLLRREFPRVGGYRPVGYLGDDAHVARYECRHVFLRLGLVHLRCAGRRYRHECRSG